MSHVQVITSLSGCFGPIFTPGLSDVNKLFHAVAAFNPGKIIEIEAFIKSPHFQLVAIETADMRRLEPSSMRTDDDYMWLGRMEFHALGGTFFVMIPGLGDLHNNDGLMLDRSIAIYTKLIPHDEQQIEHTQEWADSLTEHLHTIFLFLSKDTWFLNRLEKISTTRKKIVINVPNDHPGDGPYRKHALAIQQLLGNTPSPLAVGLVSGRSSQLLLLGTENDFERLITAGYDAAIY